MVRSTWKTAEFIGTLSAILSVLILWQHAVNHGWSSVVREILSYYEWLKNFVLTPVRPIMVFATQLLGYLWNVRVNLPDYWSDIFVLCAIYLGSRARTYWAVGLKSRAILRVVLGGVSALLICALVGVFPTILSLKLSGVLLWVVVGFAFFELVDAGWSATFFRKVDLTWSQDLTRYLRYSIPALILALPIILAGWAVEANEARISTVNYGLIEFQVYVVVLALYWIAMGVASSRDEEKGGTQVERFLASSNTRIGLIMGRVVLAAIVFIICDTGINMMQT
jgi:hypothetical protein